MATDESDTRETPFEGLFRRFGRRSDRHQLTIRLLGPVEVRGPWGPVAIGSREEVTVLAVLALHLNQTVPEQTILRAVWGEAGPPSGRTSCGSYITGLRLLLAGSGRGLRIEAERTGYRMVGDKSAVDLALVRDLVRQAAKASQVGKPDRAAALLSEASAAFRGRPLGDLADQHWASDYTTELEDLRLQILEMRFAAELECGRYEEVVPELEALAAAHPLRRSFAAQLMRALHRSGRVAESFEIHLRLCSELPVFPGEGPPTSRNLPNG